MIDSRFLCYCRCKWHILKDIINIGYDLDGPQFQMSNMNLGN